MTNIIKCIENRLRLTLISREGITGYEIILVLLLFCFNRFHFQVTLLNFKILLVL